MMAIHNNWQGSNGLLSYNSKTVKLFFGSIALISSGQITGLWRHVGNPFLLVALKRAIHWRLNKVKENKQTLTFQLKEAPK